MYSLEVALEIGLNVAGRRGADAYIHGLLGGLAAAGPSHRFHVFSYFFRDYAEKLRKLQLPAAPNVVNQVRRWPQSLVDRLEWGVGLPVCAALFARPGRFHLYHGLSPRLPRLFGMRSVATVHDLIYEVFAERGLEPFRGSSIRQAVERADRVICISRSTRDDLFRFYGTPPEKVRVIPYGLDHSRLRPAGGQEMALARTRYMLREPYFLLLGPFEYRRNHERVLRAIADLRREGLCAGYRLVCLGAKTSYWGKLTALAGQLGLADDFIGLGHVPWEDLPAIYGMAAALVHPTIYEGFGLPVLEAMACGAPVISSNTSSIPEVAGDAALLVDPESVEAIGGALRDLVTRPELGPALRAAGLERAKSFSWRRAAEQTLEVYKELCPPAS